MKSVMTPDGVEYISTPEDAVDLIYQYVGYDLAEYCAKRMEEVDETKLIAEMKAQSDCVAAEGEAEHYRDMLFDIKSVLELMLVREFENKKRLNKEEVYNSLQVIIDDITKEL